MCASLTRLMFVQHSAAGYERANSSVFNLRLNTGSNGDDEMKGGKLFQTHVTLSGNALSPNVERFDRRMTSAAMFDDRSCCRESASAT